jgi:hypothetical protein
MRQFLTAHVVLLKEALSGGIERSVTHKME